MPIEQLIRQERLPEDFVSTVDRYYRPLAERIAQWARSGPLLLGVNGGQGTGKSTMVMFLRELLESGSALKVALLSIDDLYLTRAERQQLAMDVHPLLVTRGVPGTHDLAIGLEVVERLFQAEAGAMTRLPRFDKAIDDRLPVEQWPEFHGRADVIILEGWCVGALPQPDGALDQPVNDLERHEDAEGTWRCYVNQQLAGPYRSLFDRMDRLFMLRAPSVDCIRAWRRKQEAKLRDRQEAAGADLSLVMDEAALDRFVDHYQRLTEQQWQDLPKRADAVLSLGENHRIMGLEWKEAAQ